MLKQALLGVCALSVSGAFAQTVQLTGKITNGTGQAVSGAVVTLLGKGLKDTTGADGNFTISGPTSALVPLGRGNADMRLAGSVMEVSLAKALPVTIEVFDLKSNLLKKESFQGGEAGVYRLDVAAVFPGHQLLLVRAAVGNEVATLRYIPGSGFDMSGRLASAEGESRREHRLAKTAAAVDSLQITASGYAMKKLPVESYSSNINASLAMADRWGGLKNPPVKSAGCGKALGSINKSGTYRVSSAGGRGDYILDMPTNYDKDTPYRLVFGMHCMGGTAARVAAADNGDDLSAYYSIKTHATKDNIQAIYVAPQGNGDGTWNPGSDPQFFMDILTTLEDNLCIDTTRVFVAGFSFGAMYSYALSLHYPEKIRAVATYAPANWNFNPQPTNRKIPIAYYQATGTKDDLCKWINNDSRKEGGKYTLLQHAEDNGCNTSGEIKLATSGTHVVTEFEGCNAGYPVKFSSFNGGHVAVASDPGSNVNWIETETWEFFKRF